jgi:hypothetical protein
MLILILILKTQYIKNDYSQELCNFNKKIFIVPVGHVICKRLFIYERSDAALLLYYDVITTMR